MENPIIDSSKFIDVPAYEPSQNCMSAINKVCPFHPRHPSVVEIDLTRCEGKFPSEFGWDKKDLTSFLNGYSHLSFYSILIPFTHSHPIANILICVGGWVHCPLTFSITFFSSSSCAVIKRYHIVDVKQKSFEWHNLDVNINNICGIRIDSIENLIGHGYGRLYGMRIVIDEKKDEEERMKRYLRFVHMCVEMKRRSIKDTGEMDCVFVFPEMTVKEVEEVLKIYAYLCNSLEGVNMYQLPHQSSFFDPDCVYSAKEVFADALPELLFSEYDYVKEYALFIQARRFEVGLDFLYEKKKMIEEYSSAYLARRIQIEDDIISEKSKMECALKIKTKVSDIQLGICRSNCLSSINSLYSDLEREMKKVQIEKDRMESIRKLRKGKEWRKDMEDTRTADLFSLFSSIHCSYSNAISECTRACPFLQGEKDRKEEDEKGERVKRLERRIVALERREKLFESHKEEMKKRERILKSNCDHLIQQIEIMKQKERELKEIYGIMAEEEPETPLKRRFHP
ncbi:hypothetical protein ADUPG1_006530 [Aduncisulcus paluster]|uniref:Uncharacterized protein n=1 Tax=Aduncisulcus paluster TaxID=2918883 RepID=A0ABQ5KLI8_9EUKA|nr:hypothetical protein ADUPG1_006530 [Aduncisulcus paluster]